MDMFFLEVLLYKEKNSFKKEIKKLKKVLTDNAAHDIISELRLTETKLERAAGPEQDTKYLDK